MQKSLRVRLTLNEELLGTASASPELQREYIASKAPDAKTINEEVADAGADAVADKSMTVFPMAARKDPGFGFGTPVLPGSEDEQVPFLYDYQVKGFFKDSCSALGRVEGTASKELKAHKKIIDGLVFVFPRKIALRLPDGGTMGECQRPLRAQTAQGERIALANSRTAPAGTTLEFEVRLLDEKHEKHVREWLDYGQLRGLGQWRNSGKGRFSVEYLDEPAKA